VILDRCDTLRGRIETKKRVERNAKEIARFKKVRDVLGQHAVRLASLVAASEILAEAGIAVRPLPSGSGAAFAAVRTLKESFRERPDVVVDEEQFNLVRFDRALKSAADTLDGHLLGCWRRHALQFIPPANAAVLDALATAFPSEVRLIRSESARLTIAADSLPGTLEGIQAFERDATSLQAIWGQLGGGDVPQAVQLFLKSAASPAGAGLDLLTEEVRGWLDLHRITNSFSVRVATSPR
jgi:hypothetical protein